jgi:hypothetical protein
VDLDESKDEKMVRTACKVNFVQFFCPQTLEDVVATARDVLRAARLPDEFREGTLSRLARSQLTTSRLKLLFAYKVAFEATRL